jgi:hypothetical protein
VYVGRDAESKKRKYLNKTIHGRLRDAQTYLNRMLGEGDLRRNLDSSKLTLNLSAAHGQLGRMQRPFLNP